MRYLKELYSFINTFHVFLILGIVIFLSMLEGNDSPTHVGQIIVVKR